MGQRSHLRWISLVCLTVQTTTIVTLYSYSRQIQSKDEGLYLSSTVVALAELLKLFVCFVIIFKESGYSISKCLEVLRSEVFGNISESMKVLVPAALYAMQNNLAFYALNNLDPASFQVAYQLKIPATAMFSILILNRTLRRKQWLALGLLTLGVSMVQTSGDDTHYSGTRIDEGKNRFMGLLAVIACCMSSGFSGVYFERLIKFQAKQSVWIRNFQLAFFCFLISSGSMLYNDYQVIKTDGLLRGYNSITWALVLLQSFGGLVVASVVKHADNILKGFATAISIILSTQLSFVLFKEFSPALSFYAGSGMVILSTLMYSLV